MIISATQTKGHKSQMKQINASIRDTKTIVLEEDAQKGDYIDLSTLTNIDSEYINKAIDEGKEAEFNKRFVSYKATIATETENTLKLKEAQHQAELTDLNNQIRALTKDKDSEVALAVKDCEKKLAEEILSLQNKAKALEEKNRTDTEALQSKLEKQHQESLADVMTKFNAEIAVLKEQLASYEGNKKAEITDIDAKHQKEVAAMTEKYASEIAILKEQLASYEGNKKSEIADLNARHTEEVAKISTQFAAEIAALKSTLNNQEALAKAELDGKIKEAELEKEKALNELNNAHGEEVRKLSDEIADLKARKHMGTKELGEDLECWCNNTMNEAMANGFQTCTWGKDNDAVKEEGESKGTKADFIFKVYASAKHLPEELLESVCLEMKNDDPNSSYRKKEEDHFEKLNKDRLKKGCKYAVLVSNLESEGGNDLPMRKVREYEDMYVIRPAYLLTFLNVLTAISSSHIDLMLEANKSKASIAAAEDFMNEFEALKKTYLDNVIDVVVSNVDDIRKQKENLEKAANNIEESCNNIINKYVEQVQKKLDKFATNIRSQYRKYDKATLAE